MKKNLLYLLMLLAMPLTFAACSDDDDDDVIIVDPTFTLDASGDYTGTISVPMTSNTLELPITFTVEQGEDSTTLSINGSAITVPSTATETSVELNGEEIDATLTISFISLTVTSLTGTLNNEGVASITIEATLYNQAVTVEITAQKDGTDDDNSDEDSSSEATLVDVSGEYEGTIDISLFGQTLASDAITFSVAQGENSTVLSIDDYLESLESTITLEVEIPSTAGETTLELNGDELDLESNIIGIDIVINSITGTFTAEGEGSFTIEAEAPALYQVVTITVEAQKK
ncbi:MAG: hypothetical protein LUI04_05260 [Porphyromonadaceae bacterium]|nr:hypothetical protein [Porphyromonadaceae bacterium]